MKTANYMIALLVAASFAGNVYASDDYHDLNGSKKEWFLSKHVGKLNDTLANRVEDYINQITPEKIYQIIGEELAKRFGSIFSDTFSGMISIGPFVSIDNLIGSFGKSESQIMTAAILRAIQEAKEEIIAAVEEQYRIDTRVRLESLIQNLEIYNARSLSEKPGMILDLVLLNQESTIIRNRMSNSTNFSIGDIHSYALVVSLQLSILRDIATWNAIATNPEVDQEFIDNEVRQTFASVMEYANMHVVGSHISTIDYWMSQYRNEFEMLGFVRLAEMADVPISMRNQYTPFGSAVFSYRMAQREIEFLVLRVKDSCEVFSDDGIETRVVYHVLDAKYSYVGEAWSHFWISYDSEMFEQQGCAFFDDQIVAAIGREGFRPLLRRPMRSYNQVFDTHKNDQEAFKQYVADGYLPIKQMFDVWWEYSKASQRPLSEIDIFTESSIEIMPDLNVVLLNADELNQVYDYRVSNIGGSTAEHVYLYHGMAVLDLSVSVYDETQGHFFTLEDCLYYSNECYLGHMAPGDDFGVRIHGEWVGPRREFLFGAYSPNREISNNNNEVILPAL